MRVLVSLIALFLLLIEIPNGCAQQLPGIVTDTINIKEIKPRGKKIYDPERAALLSAIIPGLGQAYNKHYYKLPFIVGGVGALYWVFQNNNRRFKSYRNAIKNYDNPNANLYVDPVSLETIVATRNPRATAERGEAVYRRYRDLTIILSCASYGLIIADAYVFAHLKGFTISKDLSFKLKPSIEPTISSSPATGIALNFSFK